MIHLQQLDNTLTFPDAASALDEPNGLLAFGGDLSVTRLLKAYRHGIFPWFSEGEPILWWSPDPRGVLFTDKFHCSRSLQKWIRKNPWRVTLNAAFESVIERCASIAREDNGTWITSHMQNAYSELHRHGHAHSIEVWHDEQLVGGLYGVLIGSVFCGESMFSHQSNASKVAFYHLVMHLKSQGADMIDCQMNTVHLSSMGCESVPREVFIQKLYARRDRALPTENWESKTLAEPQ